MNKLIIWGFFLLFLVGCRQKKCAFTYHDSEDVYCANGEIKDGVENGRFIFTQDGNSNLFQEAGFYLNGIRNDVWSYRIRDELLSVKWANYEDKNLHFRTNLFSELDSIARGDDFTNFKMKGSHGKISLTVSVNATMKDSLPEKKYQSIIKNEFSQIGYDIVECKSKVIADRTNKVYVNDVVVGPKDSPAKGSIYLKNAFGWIGKDFVDFTVSYTDKDDDDGRILFEGVLTNFYLNKQRLFYPFE